MKKFKYKTLIIFSIIFSIFMIDNVHALSMGRVTNEGGVSVRDGAGTNNAKIASLKYNDVVPLTSTIKYTGKWMF